MTTPADIRRTQGERLHHYRTTRGLSRRAIAEALNVSEGAVRHWEEGRHTPRIDHQIDLAAILDVSHAVLFSTGIAA